MEQGVPPEPAPLPDAEVPLPDAEAPLPDAGAPLPDAGAPLPDAEVAPMEDTEEIDITDLVNMTKSIKKDLDDNKTDNSEVVGKMDTVFSKLNDLEQKLSQMDSVIQKIDDLGNKVETMKEKTPQEKLELRSLDSYPFNLNPQQFFAQKQSEMQQSGKNEYVLTKQDIDNYSLDTIRNSFNPEEEDDEFKF
jgi:predicted RNase H-like nuclease (RuvC/YqgF family)